MGWFFLKVKGEDTKNRNPGRTVYLSRFTEFIDGQSGVMPTPREEMTHDLRKALTWPRKKLRVLRSD